jgi:hypothetical protein
MHSQAASSTVNSAKHPRAQVQPDESLRIGCSATAAATSGHSIVVAGANARPGRAKRSTIPAEIGGDRDLEHYAILEFGGRSKRADVAEQRSKPPDARL